MTTASGLQHGHLTHCIALQNTEVSSWVITISLYIFHYLHDLTAFQLILELQTMVTRCKVREDGFKWGGFKTLSLPTRPSHMNYALAWHASLTSTYCGVNAHLAYCLNSVLNVNQEKAIVGAFSVIVQLHRLIVCSTKIHRMFFQC